MSSLLCALWWLVAPVAAEPPSAPAEAPAATPAPASPSPRQGLDEARRAYAEGDAAGARERLQSLLTLGSALPPDVRQDTLAFLGDILYSEQGPSAAEPFFRALLDEAPGYVMDPLDHPEEVVRYFEGLRPPPRPLDVTVVTPPPPRTRGPFPWLALVPGGVAYFARGDVGPGLAVAGTQTALLVTNLVLYQQVRAIEAVEPGSARETEWRSLELATDLTAGALYVSLVVPPIVEIGRWSSAGPRAAVAVTPGALTVRGTF